MNLETFKPIVKVVINKLEGGYFHPNMRTNNPEKFGVYHRSGETYLGLDRFAGHDLFYSTKRKADNVLADLSYIEDNSYTYKNEASKQFWQSIDNADAKNKWSWNSFAPQPLKNKLQNLAAEIIYSRFLTNWKNYLTEKSIKLIEKSPKLIFHFAYATWNGSGWFKKFAADINEATAGGETNISNLITIALNSRIKEGLKKGSEANSLIKKGGEKIKEIFKTDFSQEIEKKNNTPLIILGAVAIYFLFKKR